MLLDNPLGRAVSYNCRDLSYRSIVGRRIRLCQNSYCNATKYVYLLLCHRRMSAHSLYIYDYLQSPFMHSQIQVR